MKYYDAKNKNLWELIGHVYNSNTGKQEPIYVALIKEGIVQVVGNNSMVTLPTIEEFEDYSGKSLKQLLIEFAGLDESHFSNYQSDLYVKKADGVGAYLRAFCTKTLSVYEAYNTCELLGRKDSLWEDQKFYEVPFGYMPEHMKSRGIK